MANDDNELKNNASCEERQEARQLTEEDLEQVCGGLDKEFLAKKSQWIFGGDGYVEDNIRPAELRFN